LDPVRTRFLGKMDVIFCRNVLIYFDYESRRKVVENFHDRLVDGGYLLLGHAESLLNISTAFSLKHFSHDMVYRKPLKNSYGM
ncbi:MAG: CheR family methyltransferase, partial [Nitrospirota bacterium]|nr:CheR family methyltransferase [Nitrospirota bacterium]